MHLLAGTQEDSQAVYAMSAAILLDSRGFSLLKDVDVDGQSPLLQAVRHNNANLVLQFCQVFCTNINEKDVYGHSALFHAAVHSNEGIVATLLTYGAQVATVSTAGVSLFVELAGRNGVDVARLCLPHASVDMLLHSNHDSMTPLHIAVDLQFHEFVALLLSFFGEHYALEQAMQVRNSEGNSVLHLSAAKPSTAILQMLLDSTPHLDLRNYFNTSHCTPMEMARRTENSMNLKILQTYMNNVARNELLDFDNMPDVVRVNDYTSGEEDSEESHPSSEEFNPSNEDHAESKEVSLEDMGQSVQMDYNMNNYYGESNHDSSFHEDVVEYEGAEEPNDYQEEEEEEVPKGGASEDVNDVIEMDYDMDNYAGSNTDNSFHKGVVDSEVAVASDVVDDSSWEQDPDVIMNDQVDYNDTEYNAWENNEDEGQEAVDTWEGQQEDAEYNVWEDNETDRQEAVDTWDDLQGFPDAEAQVTDERPVWDSSNLEAGYEQENYTGEEQQHKYVEHERAVDVNEMNEEYQEDEENTEYDASYWEEPSRNESGEYEMDYGFEEQVE